MKTPLGQVHVFTGMKIQRIRKQNRYISVENLSINLLKLSGNLTYHEV
jgi:hypothetical protein